MARVKGKISQEILRRLLAGGSLTINSQSRFWPEIFNGLLPDQLREFDGRAIRDAFYYLKKTGLIVGEKRNNQLYIYLSSAGEKEAQNYRLGNLVVSRPKAWDNKWRVVIFDILKAQRSKREAFRSRLKELGFYPLHRNCWVIPYPCQKEIRLLKEFFNLGSRDLWLAETASLEDDQLLKEHFRVS